MSSVAAAFPTAEQMGGIPEWERTLLVASHQRWRAYDLARDPDPRWQVRYALGFDLPDLTGLPGVRLHTPQEHAARLKSSGMCLALQAPGEEWLPSLPDRWRGRDVWAGPASSISAAPLEGWFKPATIKMEHLPAASRTRAQVEAWLDTEKQQGRDLSNLIIQCSAPMRWLWEARCWVAGREVLGVSLYLSGGTVWNAPDFPADDGRAELARQWCQKFLDSGVDIPDAVVIDVGFSSEGFTVVEANPAWASGWYGVPARAVRAVLDIAGDPEAPGAARWAWEPDPWLARAAARKTLLPQGGPPERIFPAEV